MPKIFRFYTGALEKFDIKNFKDRLFIKNKIKIIKNQDEY